MIPSIDQVSTRAILWPAWMIAMGLAAGASAAGTISGTVRDPDGAPLSGLQVAAWQTNRFFWFSTWTNTAADGSYSFTNLEEGTYHVEFNASGNSEFAHETYDNQRLLTDGADLFVTEGSAHSNIDALLEHAATISGHVYGPDGVTGLGGIWLEAYQWDGGLGWREIGELATTDDAGAYAIGGLSTGPYRVKFRDYHAGDFISQIYSNAADLDAGRDVVLPAAGTVSNIDGTLQLAGKISGLVLATNAVPVSNGWVTVYVWNGSRWAYADASRGDLDDDGRYAVGGLSNGIYRIGFHAEIDDVLDEVYDNALEREYGRDIAVVAGTTVSNIDAVLDSPAWPPRIIRQTLLSFGVEIAYVSTNDALCVLQEAARVGNGWSDVETNEFASKGVHTFIESDRPETMRFWRIQAPAP